MKLSYAQKSPPVLPHVRRQITFLGVIRKDILSINALKHSLVKVMVFWLFINRCSWLGRTRNLRLAYCSACGFPIVETYDYTSESRSRIWTRRALRTIEINLDFFGSSFETKRVLFLNPASTQLFPPCVTRKHQQHKLPALVQNKSKRQLGTRPLVLPVNPC